MKKTSIILNVIVLVGLILLYVLHFSGKNSTAKVVNSQKDSTSISSEIKIAYVDIDSVLMEYELAKELNTSLQGKQEKMKSRLEKEATEFEKEAQVFQDKVQKRIYLTQQRAEEAQQKLLMKQKELQQLELEYTNQLAYEQQTMNVQLFDSISNYIKKMNTPERFQIILAKSVATNILYGSTSLNITAEVLDGLNKTYTERKK